MASPVNINYCLVGVLESIFSLLIFYYKYKSACDFKNYAKSIKRKWKKVKSIVKGSVKQVSQVKLNQLYTEINQMKFMFPLIFYINQHQLPQNHSKYPILQKRERERERERELDGA